MSQTEYFIPLMNKSKPVILTLIFFSQEKFCIHHVWNFVKEFWLNDVTSFFWIDICADHVRYYVRVFHQSRPGSKRMRPIPSRHEQIINTPTPSLSNSFVRTGTNSSITSLNPLHGWGSSLNQSHNQHLMVPSLIRQYNVQTESGYKIMPETKTIVKQKLVKRLIMKKRHLPHSPHLIRHFMHFFFSSADR